MAVAEASAHTITARSAVSFSRAESAAPISPVDQRVSLSCVGAGVGAADGTILRFNIVDDHGTNPIFDFPLASAGAFDAVTAVWIQTDLNSPDGAVVGAFWCRHGRLGSTVDLC